MRKNQKFLTLYVHWKLLAIDLIRSTCMEPVYSFGAPAVFFKAVIKGPCSI